MAEGNSAHLGMAVPLRGNSEIQANNDTYDIITITGYTTDQTGDFLVAQTSAGTEKFVVDVSGNVTAAGTLSVSGSMSLASPIARMVLGTVALATLASNASGTTTLTGVATNMAIRLFRTAASTDPLPTVWVSGANSIGYGAGGIAVAAQTVGYWAFKSN